MTTANPTPDGSTGSSTPDGLLSNPRARQASKFFLATLVTAIIATLVPLFISWTQSLAGDSDSPPLDIDVSYGYQYNDPLCAGSWIFPGLKKPPQPTEPEISSNWAHKNNGIDSGETDLILSIQGRDSSAVNLLSMRVTQVKKVTMPKGATGGTPGCGGSVKQRVFHAYLGDKNPKITEIDSSNQEVKTNGSLTYFVTDEETERFVISAVNMSGEKGEYTECDCMIQWKIAIDWAHHDKSGTYIVDDHGKPFQTSSASWTGPRYVWLPDEQRWAL
ncbi:hypothetical protein [Streptomyces canus]